MLLRRAALAAVLTAVCFAPDLARADAPTADPGFAFVDVDNDGMYSSRDIAIDNLQDLVTTYGLFDTQRSEGTYRARRQAASLVVPTSVMLSLPVGTTLRAGCNIVMNGAVMAPSLALVAGNKVIVHGMVFADGAIKLAAGGSIAADAAMLVGGSIDMEAATGIDVGSYAILTSTDDTKIDSDSGDITGTSLSITAGGDVSITSDNRITLPVAVIYGQNVSIVSGHYGGCWGGGWGSGWGGGHHGGCWGGDGGWGGHGGGFCSASRATASGSGARVECSGGGDQGGGYPGCPGWHEGYDVSVAGAYISASADLKVASRRGGTVLDGASLGASADALFLGWTKISAVLLVLQADQIDVATWGTFTTAGSYLDGYTSMEIEAAHNIVLDGTFYAPSMSFASSGGTIDLTHAVLPDRCTFGPGWVNYTKPQDK